MLTLEVGAFDVVGEVVFENVPNLGLANNGVDRSVHDANARSWSSPGSLVLAVL